MIRLKSLEVSCFRGIKSARIKFSNGLNILYGDNELGKSSLVAAIRAALLLPPTSAEAKEYQTWGTDHIPAVTLQFEIEGTSFQVAKKFSTDSRGSATLRRMKGSEQFHVAKGRAVDGELRKLLAWGIPEPGGRGAPRGLPESYLTKALLGFQEDVESILVADIEKDKTESGRRVLTEALGALGQDPVVTSLLDQLNHRTSKVFTPSGQFKKTQDSPLSRMTREIAVREHRLLDLKEQLQKSENVEQSLRELSERAEAAHATLIKCEDLVSLAQTAATAEQRIKESKYRTARVDQARTEYKKASMDAKSIQDKFRIAIDEYETVIKTIRESETELAKLQSKMVSLQESDATTMEEKRKALDAELQTIVNEISHANLVKRLSEEIANLGSQRKDAENRKKDLIDKKTQAERQLKFSQLQSQHDVVLQRIKQHDEATNKRNETQADLEKAQNELTLLHSLVTKVHRGCVIRAQLDDIESKRQSIELSILKQDQLRSQIQSLQQQYGDVNDERNKNQMMVDDCVSQLATLRGEINTLVNSSASLAESKEKELKSQIAAAEQVITQANHVIESSKEVKEKQEEVNSLHNQLSEKQSHYQQTEFVLQCVKAREVIFLSDKAESDRDQVIKAINAIKKEIEVLKSELDSCDKKTEKVQADLSSLRTNESRSSAVRAELNSIQSEKISCSKKQQEARSAINEFEQLQAVGERSRECQQHFESLQSDIKSLEQVRESLASNLNQLEQSLKKLQLHSFGAVGVSALAGIVGPVLWMAQILSAGIVIGPIVAVLGIVVAYILRSRSKGVATEAKNDRTKLTSLDEDIRDAKTKLTVLASQLETFQAEYKRQTESFSTSPIETYHSAKLAFNETGSRISELTSQENELKSILEKLSKGPSDPIPAKEQVLNQLIVSRSTIRENISSKQIALREKEFEFGSLPKVDAEETNFSRAIVSEHESHLASEDRNLGLSQAQQRYDEAADSLRECKQALQMAERELYSVTTRNDNLTSQLGGEPNEMLTSSKQDIQKAQSELVSLGDQHAREVRGLDAKIELKETALDEAKRGLGESQRQLQEIEKERDNVKEQLNKSEAAAEQLRKLLPDGVEALESEYLQITESLKIIPNVAVDIENPSSLQSLHQTLKIDIKDAEGNINHWRDEAASAKAVLRKLEDSKPHDELADINDQIEGLEKQCSSQELVSLSVPDAKAALSKIDTELSQVTTLFQQLCGQEDAKQSELTKQKDGITQPLDALLAELDQRLRQKTRQRENLQQDNSMQQSMLSDQIKTLEDRLRPEQKVLEAKTTVKDELAKEYEEAQKEASEAQGKLSHLEKQNEASSREADEAVIENCIAESQGTLINGQSFADQLEKLNDQLKAANREARNRDKEFQMSRGQLELIGGSVVRDQIKREQEALQKIQEDAAEFEEQCNAEKYLLDVLTESNDKHSAHLGRMLADPVSRTFNQLTGNRYGTFSLEPTLIVKSVKADGEDRGYQSLSVGTRHQLAVLVRLALAAHLKATLLLDDQLVQSDPKRLAWFRDTLRDSTENHDHQIIVITCRPNDYELPFCANGTASFSDLAEIVERYS